MMPGRVVDHRDDDAGFASLRVSDRVGLRVTRASDHIGLRSHLASIRSGFDLVGCYHVGCYHVGCYHVGCYHVGVTNEETARLLDLQTPDRKH